METILEDIRSFADNAHGDQMRKYSADRYIVHPVRVMLLCREQTDDLPILAAALLHDVLEDTPVSKKEILSFLEQKMDTGDAIRTLDLVIELTDVYVKDAYPDWNRGKRKASELARMKKISADAQTVKYADILDNCREIVKHDRHFARIFLKECHELLRSLGAGNRTLYRASLEVVEAGMRELKMRKD